MCKCGIELRNRPTLRAKCHVRLAWLIKRLLCRLACVASVERGGGRGNWARAQIPPSPSPFNAGHAGYMQANNYFT